jgi:NADH-quinone oxidoreductase subunit E
MRAQIDPEAVSNIVDRRRGRPGDVIATLEDIHATYDYLPADALKIFAQRTGRSLVDLYAVATFYRGFSLEPRGRHFASVCMGTACHVRRSPEVLEAFVERLGIRPGETTADRQFSLDTVNCVGACSLGPIVVMDGEYHRGVRKTAVPDILERTRRGDEAVGAADDERLIALSVSCPQCHRSLMMRNRKLDGHPMVRLTASFADRRGWLRLSSLYGDHRSESEHQVPPGAVVRISCPTCHADLTSSRLCPQCDAPRIQLQVRGGGAVWFCSRSGCREQLLDLGDVDD